MRLALICSLCMSALIPSALATHILFATGGDPTPINTNGLPISLTDTGGGIFVFHNASGKDLPLLDLNIQFPTPTFPDGFTVDGTVFTPPGRDEQATFRFTLLPMETCAGQQSETSSCVEMEIGLLPGPLIPKDQNFVVDFDAPGANGYTGVDALVANGIYTGGTDTSNARAGDWPKDAMGGVVPKVPEPGNFGALFLGGAGLAIYYRRRRNGSIR
jgi:hypothetical protein